jgi:hypothetical protein
LVFTIEHNYVQNAAFLFAGCWETHSRSIASTLLPPPKAPKQNNLNISTSNSNINDKIAQQIGKILSNNVNIDIPKLYAGCTIKDICLQYDHSKATCLLFVGLRDRPPENDGQVVGKKLN